jgi:ATP-dependent exoDNAse (exonuclease V) beta subunit
MNRIVIQASAGSGKTFQLSSAYLALLLSGTVGARPGEVLATTFTRKAAGEIRRRVLQRLARAAQSPKAAAALGAELRAGKYLPDTFDLSAEQVQALLQQLVQDFSQLRISTLDSFFGQVASAMGSELGFPVIWQLGDDVAQERLRRSAWRQVLGEWQSERTMRMVRGLTQQGFSSQVSAKMDEAIAAGIDWWRETRDREEAWTVPGHPADPVTEERVGAALAIIDSLLPQVPRTQKGTVRKGFLNGMMKMRLLVESRNWEDLISSTMMRRVHEGDLNFGGAAIPIAFADALPEVRQLAADGILADLYALTRHYYQLLEATGSRYEELRHTSGSFGFSDVADQLERGLLAGDPETALLRWFDIYYRLDSQIRHLLVDEFQDTSRSQWRILSPIVEEIQADTERFLLAVGDQKQSIYGWRGGVRELLGVLAEQVDASGGEARSLASNWRSSQVVLDIVNQIFGGLAGRPLLADWADVVSDWSREQGLDQDFPEHRAIFSELEGGAWLHVALNAQGNADAVRAANMDRAVEVIADCLAQTSGEIAVLFRSRKGMSRLAASLRAQNIECSFEAGGTVCDSAAVLLIESALHFAVFPGDTSAAFHVASSPLGPLLGLSLELVFDDKVAAFRLAGQLRKQVLDEGLGPVVDSWCEDLAGQLCPVEHERDLRRMGQLARLAWLYQEQNSSDIGEFLIFLQEQRVSSVRPARVRLLTIHQSKGLEFETVVLPSLEYALDFGKPSFLCSRPDPIASAALVCAAGRKETRLAHPELEAMHREYKGQEISGSLSTFYVALTRAKRFLHLVVAPQTDGKPPLSPAQILRDLYYQENETTIPLHPDSRQYHAEEPDTADAVELPTQQTQLRAVAGPQLRRPSSTEPAASRSQRRTHSWDMAQSARCGTAVHAWLSRLEWLEPGQPFELGPTARYELAQGLDPNEADELWRRFQGVLASPMIAAKLGRPEPRGELEVAVYQELPYLRSDADGAITGSIDRVVVWRRGGVVVEAEVLEYKSAGLHHSGTVEPDGLVQKYQGQVREYCDAVRAIFGLGEGQPVSGRLVLLGCECVVDCVE